MRIVGGAWRGRALSAPSGRGTRPTADRVRQAVFNMLFHARWGGREAIEGARVLDVFAGTGALGLEALSRGAASAVFIERDRTALASLRANIAACGAGERARVIAGDALRPPPCPASGACSLVFLDPPYEAGAGAVMASMEALRAAGWVAHGALVVAETDSGVPGPEVAALAERVHGAARVTVWRESG